MGREEIFVRLLATLGHTFNHGARRVRELYDWLPGSGRALRRSEKELRDVIEAMPATVWRTSPDGSVDFINQNWVQATGLPSEAALGWNWQTVVHPDDRRRCIAEWNKAMKDRQPMKSEVRVRCADGEYCLWFIQNVPLRDEQGNVVKWYGSAINIQDRKRAEQERDHLHQLQDELAHINRVTTLGELASIAHELKQPITAAIINAKTCFRWLESAPPRISMRLEKPSTELSKIALPRRTSSIVCALSTKNRPRNESWSTSTRSSARCWSCCAARPANIRFRCVPSLPPLFPKLWRIVCNSNRYS